MSSVIAVSKESVSAEMSQALGIIAFWDLVGTGRVIRHELANRWVQAELEPALLPKQTSDLVILKRAMEESLSISANLVRPLKKDRAGWAAMDELFDETGTPFHRTALTVEIKLTPTSGKVLHFEPDTVSQDTKTRIVTQARIERNIITTQELSAWLVQLCQGLHAVSLRTTGGFYFLPRPLVDTWHSYREAIGPAVKVHEIPAMNSADAVAAVLESLTREVSEASTSLVVELQTIEADDPRKAQKVRTRTKVLQSLESKVSVYEGLIGHRIVELRDKLSELQGALAMGSLVGGAA